MMQDDDPIKPMPGDDERTRGKTEHGDDRTRIKTEHGDDSVRSEGEQAGDCARSEPELADERTRLKRSTHSDGRAGAAPFPRTAESAGAEPVSGADAPSLNAPAYDDDRTRVKRAPAADEHTRVRPRADAGAGAGTASPIRTANTSATGSDWAHPEQWESRHDGPLGPGSVIKGRFVLDSVLGQGGMGVVFRALDRRKEEARDREPYVAVKILGEEFRRHPNALIALQREARKAQTLAHPNVITVHDFDRDGTTVFMTMELLEGEPLNRVIAANALRGLPPAEALPIVRGAAAALAYAHQKGIVHSDFKPGNVFRTRRGDVKVLDFGIARAVQTTRHGSGDQTLFDASELGALTPSYASPEMLDGEEPAPADDVYGLAVVAYELLTGRHPFDKTPANEARQRRMKAPTLSLPSRQRRALAKALSFDRDARHADAGAFLRDLDGPSPMRKAAYASTLVVMASVAAYGVYYGNQLRPDVPFSELPAEMQRQFEDAVGEGQRALGFGDVGLNDAFDYFSRAYAIHRNNPRAIEGLEGVAHGFLRSMDGADGTTQRNVMKKLYCQEYLSGYSPVVQACRTALGQAACSVTALACPAPDER